MSDLADEEEHGKAKISPTLKKPLASAFMPIRSTKPLTVPVEFKFNQRKPAVQTKPQQQPQQPKLTMKSGLSTMKSGLVKSTTGAASSKLGMQTGKKIAKKQAPTSSSRQAPSVTVPKPFQFHVAGMIKKQQTGDYVPLAVRVKEFTKTPERFKKTSAPTVSVNAVSIIKELLNNKNHTKLAKTTTKFQFTSKNNKTKNSKICNR